MTTPGSLQLRQYLRLRRSGTALVDAAEDVGMSLAEARLTDAEEAKGLLADIDTTEPAAIGHNSGDEAVTANVGSEQLRQYIERAERVMKEIAAAREDLKAVFAEAKSTGFDTKTMKSVIKLRAMTADARREQEALLDTYKAALGMLDGTPLGHWALERLKPKKPAPDEPGEPSGESAPPEQEERHEPVDARGDEPTVDDARRLGGEAAARGEPVTSNPFPAFDERRAAWDESWCAALGSDGMEIPEALKPAPKPKKEPVHEPA